MSCASSTPKDGPCKPGASAQDEGTVALGAGKSDRPCQESPVALENISTDTLGQAGRGRKRKADQTP